MHRALLLRRCCQLWSAQTARTSGIAATRPSAVLRMVHSSVPHNEALEVNKNELKKAVLTRIQRFHTLLSGENEALMHRLTAADIQRPLGIAETPLVLSDDPSSGILL